MADVITDSGRAQSAGYLSNTVTQVVTYYGNVGTGAGTAGVTDTTLFTEVGTSRISITPTRTTTTVTNDTAQYQFTYSAGGSVSVTNAGYFTASTSGTLMQKSDHATIPLLSGDSIVYTFKNKQA
jgi:hypothetical protein